MSMDRTPSKSTTPSGTVKTAEQQHTIRNVKRKEAKKASLFDSLSVTWPYIPQTIQEQIQNVLIEYLKQWSIPEHLNPKAIRKRRKLLAWSIFPPSGAAQHDKTRDFLQQNICIGINAVTKALESQAKQLCNSQVNSTTHRPESEPEPASENTSRKRKPELEAPPPNPPVEIVFVCRRDINPPILVDHLPHLVGYVNALSNKSSYSTALIPTGTSQPIKQYPNNHVYLIQLGSGASFALAKVLGIRNCAALSLSVDSPQAEDMVNLIKSSTEPPIISWLEKALNTKPTKDSESSPSSSYVGTKIKTTTTTAPVNLKDAKREKKEGRLARKQNAKKFAQDRKIVSK